MNARFSLYIFPTKRLTFLEMHITGHKLPIVVTDDSGTIAKVTIPAGELFVFGEDNSYFICLSSVSQV